MHITRRSFPARKLLRDRKKNVSSHFSPKFETNQLIDAQNSSQMCVQHLLCVLHYIMRNSHCTLFDRCRQLSTLVIHPCKTQLKAFSTPTNVPMYIKLLLSVVKYIDGTLQHIIRPSKIASALRLDLTHWDYIPTDDALIFGTIGTITFLDQLVKQASQNKLGRRTSFSLHFKCTHVSTNRIEPSYTYVTSHNKYNLLVCSK